MVVGSYERLVELLDLGANLESRRLSSRCSDTVVKGCVLKINFISHLS